jgi:hypothetical protein
MKYFCNSRNAIPYIQDIEIINAFHDRVSDIKTVEEITMEKPKMVADMLAVTDICIGALETQVRLLDSRIKGSSKKKQEDQEVNTRITGITRIQKPSAAGHRAEGEKAIMLTCRCREVV